MNSAEIRETYLSFFESNGHKRMPSASLVPSSHDPSVLLTTAGMQPFKPYFLGEEQPPGPRLTSCQKCFRTTDIEQVGSTARHLTFFEMLGNFSFGDYFAEDAIRFGWALSTAGFGFDPEQIWVTVFEGDEELGLGPDEDAIGYWKEAGMPEERIVRLPRSENFWQAGPVGPAGPCSEMYLDRGPQFGGPDDKPGDDTERFLEYWNHVFMTYELHEDGSLTELPKKNIDTGLGLERMAAIQQNVASVFETDGFAGLVELAEQLSGRGRDQDAATTRAMRVMADHARGMTFLIADGVVPSNEDRGYILRRIMRRAIQQGRVLELEAPYLERFADRVIETMGGTYPELDEERDTILRWVRDEEESFGKTLDRGSELLGELISQARESGASGVDSAEAFKLHDTYGFPYDLTKELLADEGLSVDDEGFDKLMEEQRQRARVGVGAATGKDDAPPVEGPPTRFVGYETLRTETAVSHVEDRDGKLLVKLEESPFYPEGGGQVSDSGVLRVNGSEAKVVDVRRLGGDDQAVVVEGGTEELKEGQRVEAEVPRRIRHATMSNHTATHLLHAALRERLGNHVRQAGSKVQPDKLRFDFTHGSALDPDERKAIEDRVNEWIADSLPVRALQMERAEAERLGAMALFGEKYGDWVRVIEIDGVSRELCGGTHVANTSEIGIFAVVGEGSSAANVRRIEALTGPAAIEHFRSQSATLEEAGEILGSPGDPVAGARRAAERQASQQEHERAARSAAAVSDAEELITSAEQIRGIDVVVARSQGADQRALLDLADRIKSRLGQAAVVLGGVEGAKVAIVASFTDGAVGRGLSAVDTVQEAAAVVDGGGGGRANVAQAGGREPSRLDEALDVARRAIERRLAF